MVEFVTKVVHAVNIKYSMEYDFIGDGQLGKLSFTIPMINSVRKGSEHCIIVMFSRLSAHYFVERRDLFQFMIRTLNHTIP